MTVKILALILVLVFSGLASLHFYWVFGGKWGIKHVIPSRNPAESASKIPKIATLIVALGLTFIGLMYLITSGLVSIQLPIWITGFGYWFIPSIFLLRAIGEFKYVGFFKKIRDTHFAKADSRYFSPICLFIGIIGLLIQILS